MLPLRLPTLLLKTTNFEKPITERLASFITIKQNFLGNNKVENRIKLVDGMLHQFKNYIDHFQRNLDKRMLPERYKNNDKRYQVDGTYIWMQTIDED